MNSIIYNSPNWYTHKNNSIIIKPDATFYRVPFNKKDVNIKTSIYKSDMQPLIKYKNKEPNDYYNKSMNLLDDFLKKVCQLNNEPTKIKSLQTKLLKNTNRINTVIRVVRHQLHLNNYQKSIIQSWITECKNVYNICIDKHKINNKYFNKGYKSIKASLFNEIYGNNNKPIPYDILTDEVRVFCSNLKSCFTNLKNSNIKNFTLKKKLKKNNNYSLLIPYKSIYSNGIFKTIIGNIENLNLNILPTHDCRLYYNYKNDVYTLNIPTDVTCKNILNRNEIIAIDPGEKKFIEFYGLNSYGYIGKNIRKPLLKIRDKISKYQKILYKTKLNKSGNKLKNKHRIKNKIRKLYQKTKNIVKELHNQTANYICKNYNKILIPKFETQKMTKQTKQSFKEYKLELINRGETTEERKENAKIFTKKCRLNKKVKYVLNTLSHFSFRQHLMEKSEEYGCELKVISEEYTSVTCTNCGHMSDNYKKRLKDCLYCNYKIDRDLNGARNILLKNLDVFKYEAKKPMVTYKPM
jgi:transposase